MTESTYERYLHGSDTGRLRGGPGPLSLGGPRDNEEGIPGWDWSMVRTRVRYEESIGGVCPGPLDQEGDDSRRT